MIKFNLYKEGGLKVHFVKKDDKLPEDIKEYLEKKVSYRFKESLYLPSFLEESEIFMGLGDDELDLEDVRNVLFELGNILRDNEEHEVEIENARPFYVQQKNYYGSLRRSSPRRVWIYEKNWCQRKKGWLWTYCKLLCL